MATQMTTLSTLFSNKTLLTTMSTAAAQHQTVNYCELIRKPINITAFSFLLILTPLTIIGNSLVTLIIFTSPIIRKQTTFLFLGSLAVADTLIGLIVMPINAKMQWNSHFFCMSKSTCWLFLYMEPFLSTTSVLHLFVISIDRFISIKYAYRYNTLMTRRRVYLMIIGIWVSSIILCLTNIVKWKSTGVEMSYLFNKNLAICVCDNRAFYTMMYVCVFGIPLVIMLYIYRYVYHTALRHIKEITRLEVNMLNTNESPDKMREQKRKQRQFRTLRSIVIVFIVFFICWFPTIIYILSIFYASHFWKKYRSEDWFIVFHFILIFVLPPLNSATNPFIYVLSNRQFRQVSRQLFWKVSRCGSELNIHSFPNKSSIGYKTTNSQCRTSSSTLTPLPSPANLKRIQEICSAV